MMRNKKWLLVFAPFVVALFVAHEFEGVSFKEFSAETGVSVNTLLSRKRYAVLALRERLQSVYDEFVKK